MKVTTIFIYTVVPNNGNVTEVVPRYTSKVDSRNWLRSSTYATKVAPLQMGSVIVLT